MSSEEKEPCISFLNDYKILNHSILHHITPHVFCRMKMKENSWWKVISKISQQKTVNTISSMR